MWRRRVRCPWRCRRGSIWKLMWRRGRERWDIWSIWRRDFGDSRLRRRCATRRHRCRLSFWWSRRCLCRRLLPPLPFLPFFLLSCLSLLGFFRLLFHLDNIISSFLGSFLLLPSFPFNFLLPFAFLG